MISFLIWFAIGFFSFIPCIWFFLWDPQDVGTNRYDGKGRFCLTPFEFILCAIFASFGLIVTIVAALFWTIWIIFWFASNRNSPLKTNAKLWDKILNWLSTPVCGKKKSS